MVGIIIKVVIGLVLFAGSLVGGLAATGRLNHEGTANIPVLNSFFPEPETEESEEGGEGGEGGGHGDTGKTEDAAHGAPAGETQPADGTHNAADPTHVANAANGEPGAQGANGAKPASRSVVGPSVVTPESPATDGHGGGADAHGADPHAADASGEAAHGAPPAAGDASPGHAPGDQHGDNNKTTAERDFDKMTNVLASQGKVNYQPGAFFTFDGMPAGLTPEQINETWQRVQGLMQKIEQKKTALALRETELQELAEDISRRWKELSERSLAVEGMQNDLDRKIEKFEETVKLVRNDEIQKLKRNAASLAAFERDKAAELVQQQWSTERGQDEVLRLFEVMDKEAVNEILAILPNAMVQDVLEKRMQVSKEAAPTGGRK